MLAEVSALLAWLGIGAAAYGACAAAVCLCGGRAAWGESAHRATLATAALLGAAWLGLLAAFVADRFEVIYVAAHSGRALPAWLRIAAVWGGQEGSLLTWAMLQAGVAAQVARARQGRFGLWAIWALDFVTFFFAAATMVFSNPFIQSTLLSMDGAGLNPLLRHVGMALHPPALFLGYVALAVPFAMALAGILTGEEAHWRAAARPWVLAAWLFLGLGLLLGARWAYDVLGWGGYWGWDPVENAALMPWLTATALLHVLSRGGVSSGPRRLGGALATLSFALVIFGTFATRSGALASVHAYARSTLGSPLLVLMAVVSLAPVVAAWSTRRRQATAPSPTKERAAAATWRDGTFGLTALLLLTLVASIWIGTVLPALTEWLAGWRMEAGPEWFDRVTGPQWALLVLLMGICPLLGSATAGLRRLWSWGPWLLAGAAAVAGGMAWAGWWRLPGLLGAGVAGLAGAALLGKCAAGAARVRRETGLAPGNALLRAVARQRRRYGGHLLHLGVVCMAVGIIGTRLYPAEATLRLERSTPQTFEGYQFVLDEVLAAEGDGYSGRRAAVSLYAGDRYLTTLYPELRAYPGANGAAAQTLARPALRVGWREDVYLALTAAAGDGRSVTVHAALNRLVNWLWLGGLLLLAGGVLALWPTGAAGSEGRVRRALRAILAVGLAVLFVAAGLALWGAGHGSARAATGRPVVGAVAPGFRLISFDGETVDLAGLRGRVVVVNFWASWCPSCEATLPALERIWQDYGGRGVTVMGIASGDSAEAAQRTVAQYGLSYTLGLDGDGAGIAAAYGLTGVPETFVLDVDGRVAAVYVGVAEEADLRTELDALLDSE